MASIDNLKPVSTVDEARAKGRAGGIKSGEARKQKKLLSQIYADFLRMKHDVELNGSQQTMSGSKLCNAVIANVLCRGDSSSVRMMQELREATEGKSISLSGQVTVNIIDDI